VLVDMGSSFGKISEIFTIAFQTSPAAYTVSYPMENRDTFPALKRPKREDDHSPLSSAEVKNAWSYTSISLVRLHSGVLSFKKHRDKFYIIYMCVFKYIIESKVELKAWKKK
jgi:hypothetical protein